MRQSRLPLNRTLFLSTVFALSLLMTGVLAQDDTTSTTAATTTSATSTTATTSRSTTTTSNDDSATSTSMPTIDSDTTSTSATSTSTMPGLSSSTTPTADGTVNSDMPSLSSTAGTAIPTYPAPTVPPTNNAPFMQRSKAPDGTVFIAVGAILGACGLAVLLWRLIVSCLLHRSVERAAMAQHHANDKAAFPAPPAQFYKYTDQDSAPNVAASAVRGVRRTTRGPIPSGTPSQTNLFFSPTAAGGGNTAGAERSNRDSSYRDSSYRDSRFLPSGFYAAGSGSPQNNGNGHTHSISLTNLHPQSSSMPPGRAESPGSSGYGPQRSSVHMGDMSNNSINLNQLPSGGQRAPSAFLEDLLDERPDMFPPSNGPPSARANPNPNPPYRQSQHGRF